jgi:hypothetical protein
MELPLQEAAAVLLRARRLGADADLSDWVNSAMREFHGDKDRKWRLNNPIGGINQLATELARLTGADVGDCKTAIIAETGDCEISAAIQAILDYARTQFPAQPTTSEHRRGRVVL